MTTCKYFYVNPSLNLSQRAVHTYRGEGHPFTQVVDEGVISRGIGYLLQGNVASGNEKAVGKKIMGK